MNMNDWQEVQLGDIAIFRKGKGLPKSSLNVSGKYECIHYGELFTKYSQRIADIISRTDEVKDTFLSQDSDVLMPTSDVTPRGLSTASYLDKSGVILGGDILVIRCDTKKLNGLFLAYYIDANKHSVIRLVSGSTIFHLYGSDMARFKLLLPPVAEQGRIIATLELWESYLQEIDRKIELKRNIKKGLAQKLLNSDSSWDDLQITDLFSFVPTGNHSKEVMSYDENVDKKPFNIHYGDIHTRFSEYVDLSKDNGVPHLLIDDSKNHMLLQNGDLVVADASEDYDGVGSCVELKGVNGKRCIAGLHTFALRPRDNKIAPGFAKLVLKVPETANWLKRVSTYSKVYGVSKFNFSKTMVSIPSYSKQQEIVSILDSADDELSLLEKKRTVIKEQKKYLLNTLVNGRIRTPENLTMPAKEEQHA